MKTKLLFSLCLGAVLFLFKPAEGNAYTSVSVGFEVRSVNEFYEPLGGYGYWVDVAPYGRCWYPAYVEHGWRPYCNGYWAWTDCGWYWVSDEPWAWSCYHYGRWVYDSYYSWVWVPDTVWGPSWVCFREGGGYVGWAPLPPTVGFGGGVLVVERDVVPASWFVFVSVRSFCDPVRPRTVIVNNTTIINKTVNITKIKRVNQTVINEGPKLDVIQRVSARKIPVTTVKELARTQRGPHFERRAETSEPREQAAPAEKAPKERQRAIEERKGSSPEIIRGTPPGQVREAPQPRWWPQGRMKKEWVEPLPPPKQLPPAGTAPPSRQQAPPEEKEKGKAKEHGHEKEAPEEQGKGHGPGKED